LSMNHLSQVWAVGQALDVAHHEAVVQVEGAELGASAQGLNVAAHLRAQPHNA